MDFPVCPSCRQSVIDDDAVDCPFCGASMKGKPGAKPAAAAAAAAPGTKPAVAAKPAGAKAAPGKPTLPGDDFPFEAELTAGKSAIPAMPNPTKQRTMQVICPMCDTPGYVAPTAAGQDVRCANPKCVMPVFTVAAPKKKEDAPPPLAPKSSNLPFVAGTTLVLMLAIGGGLYFVNSLPNGQKPDANKGLSEEAKQAMAEMLGQGKKPDPAVPNTKDNGKKDPKNPAENQVGVKPVKEVAAGDLIKSALAQMNDSCLQKNKQRSKPFCRQLTAEAHAVTGNAQAAQDDLKQLLVVGNDVPYYRIIPLLDLFWSDFSGGRRKEAMNSLSMAVAEIPKIPKFGRTRLEIVGRLAAALVAAEQVQDATKLLDDFAASDSDAQLAARLQIATDGTVAPLTNSFSVLPWKFPQAVAVTASQITRKEFDAAKSWAAGQSSEDARAECLAYWAEDFARRKAAEGEADSGGTIAKAVEALPSALAARVWARAGCGRLSAKDQAGTNAAIKLAQDKLAEITVPAEPVMPEFKLTERFKLPASGPLLQAATAASELAFVQAQSAMSKPAAETSLDLALSFVDAMAPSFAAAQERNTEANQLGPIGLRERLKTELKLKNDDLARKAANNFTRSLDEIVKASQQRFDIETQILSRLRGAGVGLDTKVWIIVNTRTTSDDINKRDNFLATKLAGELIEGLKGTPEEQAILGAWNKATPIPRPQAVEFHELLQKDVNAAVSFVQTVDTKANRREEILLRTVSRLPTMNKLALAFQLISKMDDIVVREDCLLLTASVGAQRGDAEAVWKQVALTTQNTEKVAICRGLIAGLQAAGQKPPESLDPTLP